MFVCNTPYFLNIRGCGSVGHGIWPLLFEGNPFILSFQALCKIISISESRSCESFRKPFAMLIWGNKDPVTKTLVQESGAEYLELCVKWVYHYLTYMYIGCYTTVLFISWSDINIFPYGHIWNAIHVQCCRVSLSPCSSLLDDSSVTGNSIKRTPRQGVQFSGRWLSKWVTYIQIEDNNKRMQN